MAIKKIEFDGKTLIDLTADTVTAAKMRKNTTAHDANGNIITGTMADATCTIGGGGLTQGAASGGGVNGGNITGGELSTGEGKVSITQQPSVTPNIGGTGVASAAQTSYGITATKPSGIDGTDYLTFDPGATYTQQGKAKGQGVVGRSSITRATITTTNISKNVSRAAVTDTHTEGYLPAKATSTAISAATITVTLNAGSKISETVAASTVTTPWSTESSTSGTVAAGTNYYVPVARASATGGTASIKTQPTATATTTASSASISSIGIKTVTSDTGYSVTASATSGSASASANSGNSTATGGSASVSKGITSGASASGTEVTSTAVTKDASSAAKTASTVIYIQKATLSKTKGSVSATANAGTASIAKTPTASASASQSGMAAGVSDTTTPYYFKSSASAASGYSTATGGSARAYVTASSITVTEGYTVAGSVSTAASDTGTKTGNSATSTEKTASDSSTIYLKASTCSHSGGTVSGSFTGGALSGGGLSGGGVTGGGLTAGAGSVEVVGERSVDVVETTAGYLGGYMITATGRGSVNRAAVTRAAINSADVTCTTITVNMTRATVTCSHTAGYKAAGSDHMVSQGYVAHTKPSTLSGKSMGSTIAIAASSASSSTATKYYQLILPEATWASNVTVGSSGVSLINSTGAVSTIKYLSALTIPKGSTLTQCDNNGTISTLKNSDGASGADALPIITMLNNGTDQIYGKAEIKTLNNGPDTASYPTGYITTLNNKVYGKITTLNNGTGTHSGSFKATIETLNNGTFGTITTLTNNGTISTLKNTTGGTLNVVMDAGTIKVTGQNDFKNAHTTVTINTTDAWAIPNADWYAIYPNILSHTSMPTAYIWCKISAGAVYCIKPGYSSSSSTISTNGTYLFPAGASDNRRCVLYPGTGSFATSLTVYWGASSSSTTAPTSWGSYTFSARTAEYIILRFKRRSTSILIPEIVYVHTNT